MRLPPLLQRPPAAKPQPVADGSHSIYSLPRASKAHLQVAKLLLESLAEQRELAFLGDRGAGRAGGGGGCRRKAG